MQIPLSFQKILARKMPKLFFPSNGAKRFIIFVNGWVVKVMHKFRKVSDFVDAMEQLCCSQLRTEYAKHNHKVGDFAER
jgi:hypothetical protein